MTVGHSGPVPPELSALRRNFLIVRSWQQVPLKQQHRLTHQMHSSYKLVAAGKWLLGLQGPGGQGGGLAPPVQGTPEQGRQCDGRVSQQCVRVGARVCGRVLSEDPETWLERLPPPSSPPTTSALPCLSPQASSCAA